MKHKYIDKEPLPMNIIDAYFFIRTVATLIGVALYYSDMFYLTRYGFLSYIGFMFEDLMIFSISPIIPIIHAIAFAVCFVGLRRDIGIVRLLAIILLFIDVFAFPVGTAISIVMMIYLALPSTARFFKPIAKQEIAYRAIGVAIIAFSLAGFFFTSGISASVMAISDQPNLMMSALDKIDDTIDLQDEKNVPVIIEMYYTSSMMQAVEMQGVVIQNIQLMGGDVTGTTTKVANAIIADMPASNLEEIAMNPNVKRIIKDEPVVQLMGFLDEPDVQAMQGESFEDWDQDGIMNFEDTDDDGDGIPDVSDNDISWKMNTSLTGKGIVVAIVDSGINEKMRWLQRNGKSIVIDKYEIYEDYVHWHGTAVACCIASQNPDVRGVAPNVDLLDVEVFQPSGQATYSDVLKGWEWVVKWKETHPDKKVICSNSLGIPASAPSILDTASDNIVLRYNIPMIVASGNFYPQTQLCSPGYGRYVLTVGAVDVHGNIAPFSCRGPVIGLKKPDVCALGVNVATFDPSGVMITPSGTSFSTPIVSGHVALLMEKSPDYDAIQLYDAIRNGAEDKGEPGFDDVYGYGIVNLAGAESALVGEKPSRYYVYLFALLPIIGIVTMFYPEIDRKLNLY